MRFNSFLRSAAENTPSSPANDMSPPNDTSPSRESLLWQTLLRTIEDAILLIDASGHVLLSSDGAKRLFDFPPPGTETLLSHTLSSELEDAFQKCLHDRTPAEADVTLTQPAARSLHVRIIPVPDDQYLVVLRDLTELRRLERVRQDFVANVSHELRTPLTSIKAMAETLKDGARLDETVADRFLDTIVHESDRLVRLSSDLLDLSRVETRGPNKTWIDLTELIAEVAARFASQVQAADLTLENLVYGPLTVSADRDEMAQVLVNLLDNAISYTPRGGSITLQAWETPGKINISVTDTGIGILAQDIPRLFERFYRADKARSRASGGTGLGLSIVKHIVESHGGTVNVTSEYNKGSVFLFSLPYSPGSQI